MTLKPIRIAASRATQKTAELSKASDQHKDLFSAQNKKLFIALRQRSETIVKQQQDLAKLLGTLCESNRDVLRYKAQLGLAERQLQELTSAPLNRLALRIRSFIDKHQKGANQNKSRAELHLVRKKIAASGLFDEDYYVTNNPDVSVAGACALDHYIHHGGLEGRSASGQFDSAWYLAEYTDVAQAVMNPLIHYIDHGEAEGRLTAKPDYAPVAVLTKNHLDLYERIELCDEAFEIANGSTNADEFRRVDIIVPVYEGLEAVVRCVKSLVSAKNITKTEIFLINDKSPDSRIRSFLEETATEYENVIYMHNPDNLGFVKTVNRGFAESTEDVIILNADTEVSDHWVDRLVFHACDHKKVGTVTPFSNNATICSFPTFGNHAEIFADLTTGELSDALYFINTGQSSPVPTGAGSCMYVSRQLLEEVGLFNEDEFALGYGEENDLCRRAAKAGYQNLHAHDLFVFHEGEVSFKTVDYDASPAAKTLLKLHPEYDQLVAIAFERDEAYPSRLYGIQEALRRSGAEKTAYIFHAMGGGTERVVRQQIKMSAPGISISVQPAVSNPGNVRIQVTYDNHAALDCTSSVERAVSFLDYIRLSSVNIHHMIDISESFIEAVIRLGAPVRFYVHDFYSVCGRIFGLRPGVGFCGFPQDTQVCTSCLSSSDVDPNRPSDMQTWRALNGSILRRADEVIAPSEYVASELRRFYPDCSITVDTTCWDKGQPLGSDRKVIPFEKKNRFKVALLGGLGEHKGLALVRSVYDELASRAVDLVLIGHSAKEGGAFAGPTTGPYQPDELPGLLAAQAPDAIWISSIAPETYSFTLNEALESPYPVIVNNVGALPERAMEHQSTFIIDHTEPPAQIADQIVAILGGRSADAKSSWAGTNDAGIPSVSLDSGNA